MNHVLMANVEVPIINYIIFFIILILMATMVAIKWGFMESTIQSAPESASQKRWVIFMMTMAVILIALMAVLLKLVCPPEIWWGLLGIITTGLGITAWEKVKMSKNPTTPNNG